MANELQGVRVAFVVANEAIEKAELLEPRRAVDPHRRGPVAGRTLTSWPCLQTDLRNTGAYWVDRVVVVCRQGINTLVTSRQPGDLRAFCRKLMAAFAPASLAV